MRLTSEIIDDRIVMRHPAHPARDLRFGSGIMWPGNEMGPYDVGWSWYNGCGWIATYNAALLMGRVINPAEIIRFYESINGALLTGVFGLNPAAVNVFFRSIGVTPLTHHMPTSVDDLIRGSTVSVLAYVRNNLSAHYVTVFYDQASGMFRVFNDGWAWAADGSGQAPFEGDYMVGSATIPSVDEWLQNDVNNIWRPLTVTTLR